MSGPGGSTTNRDRRREARREALQRQQLERKRVRARQIRNKRLRFVGGIGVLVIVLAIIGVLVYANVGHTGGTHSGGATGSALQLQPANGQTVDGISCMSSEGQVYHIHSYIEYYVDGQQQTVPPGVGIISPEGSGVSSQASNGNLTCLYVLHVHDGEPNIVHVESPVMKSYTLGNFFDIWGKQLSASQVESHTANATHALTFYVSDASGKMVKYTGDPRNIQFANHETIAILYNSPNVQPQPFNQWAQYGL